jgi:glycosyltransferase involved in cell wall biosynthesis
MRPPEDFDRAAFRTRLGITPDELALAFVALGHFEWKGLPLLLEVISGLGTKRIKLVVVGGLNDLLGVYRKRVRQMGLADQVVFVGMQRDVRPYLWAADAFTLPSLCEVFPLVALEAAAASLPVIVTRLNGVEEYLRDGENGILVEGSSEGVARGISRLLAMPPEARRAMGQTAQRDVQPYATENFVAAWQEFYNGLALAKATSLHA